MDTRILLDHEKAGDGSAHVVRALLRVESDAPRAADRVPLNLSLVLDRSGSMRGRKLERACEAAGVRITSSGRTRRPGSSRRRSRGCFRSARRT